MTDSPHLDAGRLSDVLDGTGEPADAAHVSACRECAGRLESWRRSRRLLAAHPPTPPGRQEAAVQAALAAFDLAADPPASARPDGSAEPGATPPGGSSPGPRGARPGSSSGSRRWARPRLRSGGVAAAIAVAVLAGSITAAVEFGPSSNPAQKSSTAAEPSATAAGAAPTSAASGAGIGGSSSGAASGSSTKAPSPSGSPPTTEAGPGRATLVPAPGPLTVVSLGVVADQPTLISRLRAFVASPPSPRAPVATESPAVLACAADAAAIAGLPRTTQPALEATATYAGQPADVFVFGPVHQEAIAVSATTCRLLVAVDL